MLVQGRAQQTAVLLLPPAVCRSGSAVLQQLRVRWQAGCRRLSPVGCRACWRCRRRPAGLTFCSSHKCCTLRGCGEADVGWQKRSWIMQARTTAAVVLHCGIAPPVHVVESGQMVEQRWICHCLFGSAIAAQPLRCRERAGGLALWWRPPLVRRHLVGQAGEQWAGSWAVQAANGPAEGRSSSRTARAGGCRWAGTRRRRRRLTEMVA